MSPMLLAPLALAEVQGFRSAGIHCGIKKTRLDLGLIVSDVPASVAAVFTRNAFAGAPVHISRQNVANGRIQAIVVNSGNANACTGRQGMRDAVAMTEATGKALGIAAEDVLVCSTGIIGQPLQIDRITAGLPLCAERLSNQNEDIAQAILTTDTGPKQASESFTVDGIQYHMAGIAKGAGMIHPNMATMLAFMVTDAPVAPNHLQVAFREATGRSFNQISVDGDESTNDTAVVLANGMAGGEAITPDHGWDAFTTALTAVCTKLAKRIAADGEGATRLLQVDVAGARDDVTARAVSRAIVSSNLVKAAVHGGDPNWGRILSSAGSCDYDLDVTNVKVRLANGQKSVVVFDGQPTELPADDVLQAPEVTIEVTLDDGAGVGTAWGCDLTPEYVVFNSEYST